MAFYSYLSTKIIIAFITKSYQDLFGVRSYINALILVLDKLFKDLETGERKWQRNDLFDLFNLAYVRRGDKYWTNEKKWIDIIKAVGCEHYLYQL